MYSTNSSFYILEISNMCPKIGLPCKEAKDTESGEGS